ncbi:MAG: hypothetical protein JSW61_10960, partial [Candidatus Thorarchaeota archaeon]
EGRLVQWVIWISESIQYEILKNGLTLDSGTIDRSGIIGTNITGLGLGSHNYTLVVRSDSGDSKKDTVFVNVIFYEGVAVIPAITVIATAAVVLVLVKRESGQIRWSLHRRGSDLLE